MTMKPEDFDQADLDFDHDDHYEGHHLSELHPDDMAEMMVSKAAELFRLCDTEDKGFITKRDMQRLRSRFPISPDQLEIVFDSLDGDRNGYLTLEEFTEGFGSFLGVKARSTTVAGDKDGGKKGADDTRGSKQAHGDVFEGEGGGQVNLHKVFNDMMMQIDARGVFQDEEVVKAMWMKLHEEEPDLVSSFEDFLCRTACELKKSKGEFFSLEQMLKSKANEHEEEVKKLYEEMEFQMKREQERILAEERAKEKQLKDEMEHVLREKELQLLEMQKQHQQLEEKLAQLNTSEARAKEENQRLLQEKEALEELLSESQDSLEESRSYISILQAQQKDEKKERASYWSGEQNPGDLSKPSTSALPTISESLPATKEIRNRAALQLSEGIAMERESLVKQLGMLKDVNKKLLDDKDEAEAIEARLLRSRQRSPRNNTNLSSRDPYFPNTSLQGRHQSQSPRYIHRI